MDQKASAKVLVLDFGAQYGQLIARRVRDLNVYSEIVPCDISADEIREMNASALILSGGPPSLTWAFPSWAFATAIRSRP